MHLAWNDRRTRQFLTNVGLITSNGPIGPDIMAAEWTHHISYSPSLIAIKVRGHDATAGSIQSSVWHKYSGTRSERCLPIRWQINRQDTSTAPETSREVVNPKTAAKSY